MCGFGLDLVDNPYKGEIDALSEVFQFNKRKGFLDEDKMDALTNLCWVNIST